MALDAETGAEVWRFDPLPERICGTDTRHACTTDAECSGSSCVPFLVCRSGSGEQTQSQLCASDADCTPPASCQQPLGSGLTSSAAIDAGRGAVYVDFGDCIGAGNTGFSNSLVALDAETGALRWDFSPIPNGNLGDLDFISSPNIFTTAIGSTPTPVVGVGSKNGVYYAVEQDTGALVWQQVVVAGGEAGGFSPSTGVAFGKIYAATFTGPPYIFASTPRTVPSRGSVRRRSAMFSASDPPGSQAVCTSWATARVSCGRSMPGRVPCSGSSTSEAKSRRARRS